MVASPRFITPVGTRLCRRWNSPIAPREETVAAAILDYLHVEQTLHGPYVFVPVHRTFLWVSYGVAYVRVQLRVSFLSGNKVAPIRSASPEHSYAGGLDEYTTVGEKTLNRFLAQDRA